ILFSPCRVPARMDWSGWRDEFKTFRTTTYLNTCSLAPLAARVRAAQERFLDEWEALGASAWYELWIDALDSLRGKVALVLGGRVAQPNRERPAAGAAGRRAWGAGAPGPRPLDVGAAARARAHSRRQQRAGDSRGVGWRG